MTGGSKSCTIQDMSKDIKGYFAEKVRNFRLPRYDELPDMGLYLEQVTKFINGYIVPLGLPELTLSMISNYVKKGVIAAPIKKQYYAEQIGYLFFVSVAKSVISIDSIIQMLGMQQATYDSRTAYNYFCSELENMLWYICGLKDRLDNIGVTNTEEKTMFRSVIIAVSHMIFLGSCFEAMEGEVSPDADAAEGSAQDGV